LLIFPLIGVERKGGKVGVMKVHVADHPLISHKLTLLRDKNTDSPTFRHLVEELVTLLAYEATRDVRVEKVEIVTPFSALAWECSRE
jgi:uracil phosphoribosyltransferase